MNAPHQPLLLTRRRFLQGATLLPCAAVAGVPLARASAAFAPIQHTGGALLKPTLNAYSFAELLNAHLKDPSQGIDLFAVCDFCAKLDIDAVDLTGYFFPGYPQAPEDGYLYRIKRRAHDLGLAISGTGVRNDFATADQAVRAAGVQLAKQWVEVAAKLGAPTIRLFAGPQPPFLDWPEAAGHAPRAEVEGWMAEALRECAEHGRKFGVIIAVQNHGDFLSTGEEHLRLLQRVDHDWCGALVDTGRYLTSDPYADIAMMVPYAVNWQIKETPFGEADAPRTDFKKLITIIRRAGYRGYLPIETLAMGRKNYDPFVEVARVLAEMRAVIAATAPV